MTVPACQDAGMRPERHSTYRSLAYTLGAGGLAVVVTGSFLPWLQSGEVRRNSYASFGELRRLIGFHGPAEAATRTWPLLGICAALVVIAALAGLVRTSAAFGLLTAAWTSAVSGAVLAQDGANGVRIVPVGPGVTLTGDIAVIVAAILTLTLRARRPQPVRSPR